MEKQEYQIDYKWEEDPFFVLPLCVGGLLLSGELFKWLNSLNSDGGGTVHLMFLKILYCVFFLCCTVLAVWRLVWTIHATEIGLEYRFLGKCRKVIEWSEFSCASKGRSHCYRGDLIYLIPGSFGGLPEDRWAQYKFRTRHYRKLIHLHATKNNIRAISTWLSMLE